MKEPGSVTEHTLLSRSAFIFAIRFFPAAASLAVMIAFSHLVSPALYGIYQQLWTVYLAIFIAVACFGIPPLMLTHTSRSVHRWLLALKARHVTLFFVWLFLLAGLLAIFFYSRTGFDPLIIIALLTVHVWILLIETYLIINQKFILLVTASLLY